jgi:hypothetical protein
MIALLHQIPSEAKITKELRAIRFGAIDISYAL